MALSQTALQASIASLALTQSPAQAAQGWQQAYAAYALKAQDNGGNLLAAAPAQASFGTTLAQSCFANVNGTAAGAASAYANAFSLFWAAATFVTPGAPAVGASVGGTATMSSALSSVVTSVLKTSLEAQLLKIFSTLTADTASRAKDIAAALHTATTTSVFVLMSGIDATPPPAGPLPTTQLGHMH